MKGGGQDMTFFEVYDRWLDEHKAEVKQTTVAAYLNDRKTFSRFIADDTDIRALDEDTMRAIFDRLRDSGMSSNYMGDLLMVYRMVMRYADKKLCIDNLPSIDWRIKNVSNSRIKGATRPRVKRFSVDEYERIIRVFEGNPSPGGLAVVVAMFTGLRIGEVCGLKFSDIDIDEGLMHIQRTCVSVTKEVQKLLRPDEEYVMSRCLQSPKSATSDRFIPLIPKLRKILQAYAKIYPGEYFIATLTSKPTSPRTLRMWYMKMLKAAKVPYLNFHCLRHTFATQMIEKGVDVKTVSSILGHAGVEITMDTYCHPSDDVKRAGIQKAFKGLLK